jgi:hypothetical protein
MFIYLRWVGHVVHMGEMRNAYSIFIEEPERMIPHIRIRHIYDISVDPREVGW